MSIERIESGENVDREGSVIEEAIRAKHTGPSDVTKSASLYEVFHPTEDVALSSETEVFPPFETDAVLPVDIQVVKTNSLEESTGDFQPYEIDVLRSVENTKSAEVVEEIEVALPVEAEKNQPPDEGSERRRGNVGMGEELRTSREGRTPTAEEEWKPGRLTRKGVGGESVEDEKDPKAEKPGAFFEEWKKRRSECRDAAERKGAPTESIRLTDEPVETMKSGETIETNAYDVLKEVAKVARIAKDSDVGLSRRNLGGENPDEESEHGANSLAVIEHRDAGVVSMKDDTYELNVRSETSPRKAATDGNGDSRNGAVERMGSGKALRRKEKVRRDVFSKGRKAETECDISRSGHCGVWRKSSRRRRLTEACMSKRNVGATIDVEMEQELKIDKIPRRERKEGDCEIFGEKGSVFGKKKRPKIEFRADVVHRKKNRHRDRAAQHVGNSHERPSDRSELKICEGYCKLARKPENYHLQGFQVRDFCDMRRLLEKLPLNEPGDGGLVKY